MYNPHLSSTSIVKMMYKLYSNPRPNKNTRTGGGMHTIHVETMQVQVNVLGVRFRNYRVLRLHIIMKKYCILEHHRNSILDCRQTATVKLGLNQGEEIRILRVSNL
jgi:hypothetical protein